MLELRKSEERGVAEHGWLSSRHSFSFADYHDPQHMGFGPLRVINEDRVKPGHGFGTHGHRDMEIISYVLEGALAHKDSTGSGSVVRPGSGQRMSAGRGVMHSEFNHSQEEPVHFLQIWIEPNVRGIEPSYEEKHVALADRPGQWQLIASPDGRDGSVRIHQDACIHAAVLDGNDRLEYAGDNGRLIYVHVARGELIVNNVTLKAGDALKVREETLLTASNAAKAEILLFDLPAQP